MKRILFTLFLLLSAQNVYSVDWQYIDTGNPDINMFIDKDSVKQVANKQYLYAVRYQVGTKDEKVVFLKSDYDNNYLGIISSQDYDVQTYNPNAVFANPHVFMKPIKENSFLSYAHKYTLSDFNPPEQAIVTKQTETFVQNNPSEKPVAFKNFEPSKDDISLHARPQVYTEILDNYVRSVRTKLEKNWNAPKKGKNTLAKVTLVIASNGELLGYKFTKLSGVKENDVSIVETIKACSPFETFPDVGRKVNNVNIKLEFSRGFISKVVK